MIWILIKCCNSYPIYLCQTPYFTEVINSVTLDLPTHSHTLYLAWGMNLTQHLSPVPSYSQQYTLKALWTVTLYLSPIPCISNTLPSRIYESLHFICPVFPTLYFSAILDPQNMYNCIKEAITAAKEKKKTGCE